MVVVEAVAGDRDQRLLSSHDDEVSRGHRSERDAYLCVTAAHTVVPGGALSEPEDQPRLAHASEPHHMF